MATPKGSIARQCMRCGQQFPGKQGKRFCSVVCRNGGVLACARCGSQFPARSQNRRRAERRYCSYTCMARDNGEQTRAKLAVFAECAYCRQSFQRTQKRTTFCSRECSFNAHAVARPGWWQKPDGNAQKVRRTDAGKVARRSLRPQHVYGQWVRQTVYERDRWVCGICGEGVDAARVLPDPLCATLDHITPLADGGTNELSNLRLAHYRCNHRRGNETRNHARTAADTDRDPRAARQSITATAAGG